MAEELLDIVDEKNRPLGFSRPRSQVHRDGDWHRTVHIYIFDAEGNLLVQKRSIKKDLNPGRWDMRFGGHILAGQTVDEGVLRELEEETGLKLKLGQLIKGACLRRDNMPNREFTQVYFFKYDPRLGEMKFADGEVDESKWMKIAEITASMEKHPDSWTSSSVRLSNIVGQFEKSSER